MTIARAVVVMLSLLKWTPGSLNQELLPIAYLESSNGTNINHKPHSKGEFFSSYGALGLKPATAYDEYMRNSLLQLEWPGLSNRMVFTASLKSQPALYNDACNA